MLIHAAIKSSVDVKAIADKWVKHNAATLAGKSETTDTARAWITLNTTANDKALMQALEQVYGSGWAYGTTDTAQQLGASLADPWANWQAGNQAAAALVDAPKGLQALLDKAGVTIDGINATTLDRLGTQLANSLAQGLGAEQTANNLLNVLNDPARAMVIARTETARAICDSNVSNYRDNGVTQMQWLTADPCPICEENDGEIVDIGDAFPSGDDYPPAHPNCVCDVAPVSQTE